MLSLSATYSPEDNKLRLYASQRLDAETYAKVKAEGFRYAPKQDLFVAPSWSPSREDLLLDLCGEIDDEDTSLVDRAEAKAERLETLSEKRAREAEAAKSAVSAIADNIPLGQPILVGHHSEKRARKDAEKIENGMRKAVRCWELSQYWQDRASGALAAAKYKELPAVRHRRIKGLESELRKHQKEAERLQKLLAFWSGGSITREQALTVCNYMDHGQVRLPDGELYWSAWGALDGEKATVEEIRAQRLESLPRTIAHYQRWIDHTENRLVYERAMLDEQGGIKADGFDLQIGGQILTDGYWLTILKLNKAGGRINSVSTNNARWPRVVPVERIKDYRPPSEEQTKKAKQANKLPPLCNYPGEGFVHITQEQWDKKYKDFKGTRAVAATETAGAHRVRSGSFSQSGRYSSSLVYITDAKRKDPPKPDKSQAGYSDLPLSRDLESAKRDAERAAEFRQERENEKQNEFGQLRKALRAGVQVVSAPQLFPTPPDVAARVVELAEIEPGMNVLEPSAGTGNLIRAMLDLGASIYAVEINSELSRVLRDVVECRDLVDVRCADFLSLNGELGKFDRIVMNPPFRNGEDIRHIEHAKRFLAPGGRLVSVCADGPRQREKLMEDATAWIDLPAGSFTESGTEVSTAIVVYDA